MWLKQRLGTGIGWMGAVSWDVTLAWEQCWQSKHELAISEAMQRHTTIAESSRLVALVPRWAVVGTAAKTSH